MRRKKRVKKKILGTLERPRLVVYRSNKHIYAQIVDDVHNRTITGCSTLTPGLKESVGVAQGKVDKAKLVGERIATLAKEKGIKLVSFDRNGKRFHGRVKAIADAAREAGLEF